MIDSQQEVHEIEEYDHSTEEVDVDDDYDDQSDNYDDDDDESDKKRFVIACNTMNCSTILIFYYVVRTKLEESGR